MLKTEVSTFSSRENIVRYGLFVFGLKNILAKIALYRYLEIRDWVHSRRKRKWKYIP